MTQRAATQTGCGTGKTPGTSLGHLAGLLAVAALMIPAPLLWAAQAFQESSGQVVMEAEHFDQPISRSSHDWLLKTTQTGFSGSGYMEALPNTGATINTGYTTTSPELVFNVQVTTTGTYYVWVRGAGPSGNDDTIHSGLDGTGPASADRISGFGTGWTWKRDTMDGVPATLIVGTSGLHTIHLWMREDGFKVDKLLLRKSTSSTAPSGTGPAESLRITVGDNPPSGTITINGGAPATKSQAVTLTLSATDDSGTVAQMQFSNDGSTWSTPEAYATSKSWTLAGGDGTKTVSAKFADGGVKWSLPASDSIVLDTIAPVVTITSPLDGDVFTAPEP